MRLSIVPAMHHFIRLLLPGIALATIGAWAVGSAGAADDQAAAMVARVGETTIGRPQWEAALRRARVLTLPDGPQRRQAEATVLEQLVDEVLLRDAVARESIVADPAAVDAAIDQLQRQIKDRGGTFAAFLEQTGRDEAGLREQVALELATRKFVEQRLTPRSVEAYFEKRRREIDGTVVRVSHVVLRPDVGRGDTAVDECLGRAAEIRGRILQGELTFAEAVRAHSAGPSRRRDGDVGYMPRHSLAHEEFAKQAFALAKGDISRPFVTPFGVHILQVTDVQNGKKTLALLRPEIERAMAQQVMRDTLAEARRTVAIEYAAGVPHFDPATPAEGSTPRRVVVEEPAAGR